MKKVRIPFSLNEYQKGGYEVENKFCDSVRIVCTDAKGAQPILALLFRCGEESDKRYSEDGRYYPSGPSDNDLVLIKPEFEDGDIVYTKNSVVEMISIFKNFWSDSNKTIRYHANIGNYGELGINSICDAYNIRLATDEEKKRLFDALAKNGKRWNAETKQVEDIKSKCIFKPFDKVLVRDNSKEVWFATLFSNFTTNGRYRICDGCYYDQCIPYNDETEHLIRTTYDAPKKYKTW